VKNWLKELLSETFSRVWLILSAASTIFTFFLKGWSEKPRLVSATALVLGFAWANFRLFQKQRAEIDRRDAALSSYEARVSQLRITPGDRSRYILAREGNAPPHGDFKGSYLELDLMVENAGRRDSTVNEYQVEIVELKQTFKNLKPIEGKNGIQGRHCQYGLQPQSILSTTGNIRIRAENTTDRGILLLFVPDVDMEQFANAGLKMRGDERRFGPLHCRLTLSDLTKVSATADFVLEEA
jgi:hypothetical protein